LFVFQLYIFFNGWGVSGHEPFSAKAKSICMSIYKVLEIVK